MSPPKNENKTVILTVILKQLLKND